MRKVINRKENAVPAKEIKSKDLRKRIKEQKEQKEKKKA